MTHFETLSRLESSVFEAPKCSTKMSPFQREGFLQLGAAHPRNKKCHLFKGKDFSSLGPLTLATKNVTFSKGRISPAWDRSSSQQKMSPFQWEGFFQLGAAHPRNKKCHLFNGKDFSSLGPLTLATKNVSENCSETFSETVLAGCGN